MSNILVISAGNDAPSGLGSVLQAIIGRLLKSEAHVTCIGSASTWAFTTVNVASETDSRGSDLLTVKWWPPERFQRRERGKLCYHLEQEIDEHAISRVLSLDVGRCGFTATVAARLAGVSSSALVTYKDAFDGLLNHPHELETTVRFSDHLLTANPQVLSHLARFFDIDGKAFLLDSRPCLTQLGTLPASSGQGDDGRDSIVSTGELDSSVHLPSLFQRVETALSATGASRWQHLGIVTPTAAPGLYGRLMTDGMLDAFTATGVLPRCELAARMLTARAVVRFDGARNTNLGAYEAEAAGLRLFRPDDDPFPAFHDKASFRSDGPELLDWANVAPLLSA